MVKARPNFATRGARSIQGVTALLVIALAAGAGPRTPSEVRIGGNLGGLTSLDPDQLTDTPTFQVLSNLYEGLAGLDADSRIVPVLAESWSTDGDRTWVFALRRGVRFHDGVALTAGEVKRALERSLRSPPPRGQLDAVAGIVASGERELRIPTRPTQPLV